MPDEVRILDPSDKFRPELMEEEFRNFCADGKFFERVKKTYYTMHEKQTYKYAKQRKEHWMKFDHGEMGIMEILQDLNALIDLADPDCGVPNIMHAFQTAEKIREQHPDLEWFQLTGLIHDIGKIMAIWGEPQYSTVGDTFVTGCAPQPHIVFGTESFANNPDSKDPKYSTKLGVYKENCGLENVTMSWGHDEYLYQVLKHNQVALPEEMLYIIRFHSFFPWHHGGDYEYLTNSKDNAMKKWVLEFKKYDLYSKHDKLPDIDEVLPYYKSLIDKYIPGKLKW